MVGFLLPAARSGGRSRSHFVTYGLLTETQMIHLEASNAESAQRKDV